MTPGDAEVEDVVDQLQSLRTQGKIRYFGASSHSTADMRMWLGRSGTPVAAIQVMLNLFEIPALETFAPTALRKDLGLIAREPFARGRLLPPKPSAAGQLGFLGQQYDARFENCATALARTVPQMAIQFLAQSAGVSVVLAGMSSAEHVRANVRALELPSLSQQDMLTIRAIATDERIRPTSD